MTRQQAREHINKLIATELPLARKKVNGQATYVCPFCGNGSGKDGTGICTKDGKHFTCFKGCFTSLDYLDILKKMHETAREADIFDRYGLAIDKRRKEPKVLTPSGDAGDSFFQAARSALDKSPEALAYLRSRGISLRTAEEFGLGYCPEWKSPAALRSGKNPPASRRLIIPTGGNGYTARAIDEGTPPQYRFMKEGEAGYFHFQALYGIEPVFIVEAAFDAMSVCEVGGRACALGSTGGVDKFLERLGRERPTVPLVLSLDNDRAGRDAQSKLRKGLEALRISCYEVNVSGEYKDPNEHLQRDREGFAALVTSGLARDALREATEERNAYLATSAAHYVGAFWGEVAMDTPAIPTGFTRLDAALDGGLFPGLYIVGAISSLGKTTFLLQAADQIARQGRDVLFFSLEMSRFELMAKSVSRLTLKNCGGRVANAKTTRGILAGGRWEDYGEAELALVRQSMAEYGEYSRRIFIHEGVGMIGVERMKQEVQRHISFTGNLPVVMIDYLQIIAPHDERATDKQIVDRAVLELKRLSRDKRVPVVAISSFNRDNYTAPVNMASFKESGGVEYSSDVLLGLQLAGMDELKGEKAGSVQKMEEWKAKDPRRVQLKVLKNRNGQVGGSVEYDYYPRFNWFQEG